MKCRCYATFWSLRDSNETRFMFNTLYVFRLLYSAGVNNFRLHRNCKLPWQKSSFWICVIMQNPMRKDWGNQKIPQSISYETNRRRDVPSEISASDDKSLLFGVGMWIYVFSNSLALCIRCLLVKPEECKKFHQFRLHKSSKRQSSTEWRNVWFKLNYAKFILPKKILAPQFLRNSLNTGERHIIATAKMEQWNNLCKCLLCFKLNFTWIIAWRWNLDYFIVNSAP